MTPAALLQPPLHGAAGIWDEVISIVPVLLGAALLLYMYFSSRRRESRSESERERER